MLTYIVEASASTFFTTESVNYEQEKVYTHTWSWTPQDNFDPFVGVRNWMLYELCCKAARNGYAYTNFQSVLRRLEGAKEEDDDDPILVEF